MLGGAAVFYVIAVIAHASPPWNDDHELREVPHPNVPETLIVSKKGYRTNS